METNKNADLIERGHKILATHQSGGGFSLNAVDDLIKDYITALESQPFDVLDHLQGGGKVSPDQRTAFRYFTKNNHLEIYEDGIGWQSAGINGTDLFLSFLMGDMLRPYHEPPAEGSREWAAEQDAQVWHRNFHTGSLGVSSASIKNGYYGLPKFDKGWSIWVEPVRESGWYLVEFKNDDSFVTMVFHFDGDKWGSSSDDPHQYTDQAFAIIGAQLFINKGNESHIFGGEGEEL